jgi:hypothetical protein
LFADKISARELRILVYFSTFTQHCGAGFHMPPCGLKFGGLGDIFCIASIFRQVSDHSLLFLPVSELFWALKPQASCHELKNELLLMPHDNFCVTDSRASQSAAEAAVYLGGRAASSRGSPRMARKHYGEEIPHARFQELLR